MEKYSFTLEIYNLMICYYYLTYTCNCSCDYCTIWQDKTIEQGYNASIENVVQNLNSLIKIGCKNVFFTGGEPFLYENFSRVLTLAKEKGFRVSVLTNGLNVSEKLKSVANFIDHLFVSLSYPVEEEHNRIKGQECFVEAIDTINSAINLGIQTNIDYLLTRDSVRYLPEIVELATKLNVKVRIIPIHHCLPFEGFEDITFEYIKRYENNPSFVLSGKLIKFLKKGGNNPKKTSCKVLDKVITISPDNCLLLPCFWIRHSSIPINGKLEEILSSDILKGYKSLQGKLFECKGCAAIESFDFEDSENYFFKIFNFVFGNIKKIGKNFEYPK